MELHSPFFRVRADKALSNSFGRYLQNGLSLWLWLSLDASLRYLLIFGTYDIRLIFPPCLHPLFAYYNASLSPCFVFSALITPFIHLYVDNLCFSWFLSLYSFIFPDLLIYFWRQMWVKMQWFNTVQRQRTKGLFSHNNWNDWRGLGLWELFSTSSSNEPLLCNSNICHCLSTQILFFIEFFFL